MGYRKNGARTLKEINRLLFLASADSLLTHKERLLCSLRRYAIPSIVLYQSILISCRMMALTIPTPGISNILADFNINSSTVSSLAVIISLLSLALGPLLFSSLGEVYGRLSIYNAANTIIIVFVIGNALSKKTTQLTLFRLITGRAASMPLAMGGGTITDATIPAKRGFATGTIHFRTDQQVANSSRVSVVKTNW